MYQFSYSEVIADSPSEARDNERRALDHAIMLLQAVAIPDSLEAQEALTFVTQLWSLFIKDLANPGNDLPGELRARLMSVGLWIMAEVQRIQYGESTDFAGVADVCGLVRDGLQ